MRGRMNTELTMEKLKLMNSKQSEILELYSDGNYHEVIAKVDSFIEQYGLSTNILIVRSHAIQLIDDDSEKYDTLDELKEGHRLLTEFDSQSIYAKLEYAHMLDAIFDDPKAALNQAEQAYELCHEYMNECKDLIKSCRQQIEDPENWCPEIDN